jgi:hypothetical protein
MCNVCIDDSLQVAGIFAYAESSLKHFFLEVIQLAPITLIPYAPKSIDDVHQNVFPLNPQGVFDIMRFFKYLYIVVKRMKRMGTLRYLS